MRCAHTGLLRSVLLVLVWQLFSGCAGPLPVNNYYSLATVDATDFEIHNMARLDVSLGVGPLSVPDYLKRPQIATRLAENRYKFEDSQRWAGLIEQDMLAVITSNLGLMLSTDKVAAFPWLNFFKPDYRIAIDVLQFDSALDGDAVFKARWSISDATGRELLASGKSDLRTTLQQSSYDALVRAESELLERFSKELAGQVQQLAD